MQKVFIVGAGRTPIGTFLGGLSSLNTVQLGIIAAKATMERTGISPDQV
jgi:acetyl-CoA C-acetyltransferase